MNTGRDLTLEMVYKAFLETGYHFLVKQQNAYGLFTQSDDLGYFFYVSMISSFLGIDALSGATLLFNGLMFLALMVLFFGFFCKNSHFMSVGCIVVGLLRLCMPLSGLNKVYLAGFFSLMFLPWLFVVENKKSVQYLYVLASLMGFFSSIFDKIRLFSSLPLMVFSVIFLWGTRAFSLRNKILAGVLFSIVYQIPTLHFEYEFNKRNAFLIKNGVILSDIKTKHIFWHNIYAGLGFLHNQEGITWSDTCAEQKALSLNPEAKYPGFLYEKTIRNEIFRLCKEKKYFIATTIFAKLGVLLYFFLLYFGWLGVLISWFYPKPWYRELAFWGALAASALPGVLTLPVVPYLIGFITLTVLYAIDSTLWVFAIKKRFMR